MRLPIERIEQSGEESSFAFHLRGAITALPASQSGIKQVSHRVAEHVEGVDEIRQGKTGKERQPWGHLHVLTSFPAEIPPQLGILGGNPNPRKLKDASQIITPPPDVDAEDDDDRRHNVGQHMA